MLWGGPCLNVAVNSPSSGACRAVGGTLLEAVLFALGVKEPGSTERGMEGTPVTLIKTEAGNLFMIRISNHYVVHMKLTL